MDPNLSKGLAVRACFGWSRARADTFFTPENLADLEEVFVSFRPSDIAAITNVGVEGCRI
jgi:hypothetical protein